jgi:1-phosphofructokinase
VTPLPPPLPPPSGDRPLLLLTVTPNPSLDLLFETEALVWDDANRMADPRRRPGGQGINVVRAVRALGVQAVAAALLAGRTGAEISAALRAEATPLIAVEAGGETRTFVAVRERGGRSLLLNARGPARSDADGDRLLQAVEAALAELRPRWLACCGSLPAGLREDFYVSVIAAARSAGARVVVDCDGPALQHAASAGCDLLVPNQHEALRLAGTMAADPAAAGRLARRLVRAGTPCVAITLGARGAVLADASGCWAAAPPSMDAGSAVGAGDAFLAALLIARDRDLAPAQCLRLAVAAGTAALRSHGSALLESAVVDELLPGVAVRELVSEP